MAPSRSHASTLLTSAALFLSAALMMLGGCDAPPEAPPRAPSPPASAAPPATTAAPPTTVAVAPTTVAAPSPAATLPTPEAALELARGLCEASSKGEASGFLRGVAAFPFDLDGKVQVGDAAALEAALPEQLPQLDAQLKPHTTCVAITRAALLEGAQPWPWLDRLGQRPPRAALERDLERLGVGSADQLVNCYRQDEAGFTLIITRLPEGERVRSLRN